VGFVDEVDDVEGDVNLCDLDVVRLLLDFDGFIDGVG